VKSLGEARRRRALDEGGAVALPAGGEQQEGEDATGSAKPG
jgi:hypothetical protein